MDREGLDIFKLILFFAGLVIIGICFRLVCGPLSENELTDIQKFFWIDIVACYLIFFVPLFFSSISSKNIDTKITSATNIWLSVIILEIIFITLAILVLNEKAKLSIAIVIELVAFFLAAIFVYFGYFAGTHIGEVAAAQEKSLNHIKEVKTAFEMLDLKAKSLTEDYFEQKKALAKICDDVRYLSPVDTDVSDKLEMKLVIGANVLLESTLTPEAMNEKIAELSMVLNQRKLLRK